MQSNFNILIVAWNNGIYPSMSVSFTRICRTLVSEARAHPEMLRVFWYIDMLTCVIYNCTQLNSKDDWSYLFSYEDYRQRHVGVCAGTWYKWIQLLQKWSCSCPATCQHACVNQKQPGLLDCVRTAVLYIGVTLNFLRTLPNITGTAGYVAIVTIISSVFLECTSYELTRKSFIKITKFECAKSVMK